MHRWECEFDCSYILTFNAEIQMWTHRFAFAVHGRARILAVVLLLERKNVKNVRVLTGYSDALDILVCSRHRMRKTSGAERGKECIKGKVPCWWIIRKNINLWWIFSSLCHAMYTIREQKEHAAWKKGFSSTAHFFSCFPPTFHTLITRLTHESNE